MEKFITMPKLGMTMTEGTILHWFYHEGEMVEKGEPLVEIMTDKVNMEVEAPFAGHLVQILAQDGETLPIGARLAMLVDQMTPGTSPVAIPHHNPSSLPSAPIASTPAAKREAALHAIDLHTVVQAGATPPLNRADILAFIERKPLQTIRATPLAQKIATAHHIDLHTLATLKPGIKVTRADVEAYLTTKTSFTTAAGFQPSSTQLPHGIPSLPASNDELIPLSPVRRLIGQRMLNSITTAPHIYLDIEIDMTEAQHDRQQMAQNSQKQDSSIPSITAIVLYAVARALVLHPEVNATFAAGALQGKDAIRRWGAVHIGIAVDTEQALLTPVIRNAHQQSLSALTQELQRLSQAARQGTLKPEDMAHATFTISNLGMYGIDTFHAIIAPGQGAILAVGKITKRGVVVEDSQGERLEIRPIMKVSLSADHRILDGASGSRFLYRLKTLLEDPDFLL